MRHAFHLVLRSLRASEFADSIQSLCQQQVILTQPGTQTNITLHDISLCVM
jgi:hypothetical protein